MNAYYEFSRENNDAIFVQKKSAHNFPEHFHAAIEIFIVTSGKCVITYADKEHVVTPGTVVVFDSYEVHGYNGQNTEAEPSNADRVVIIPFKYLGHFNELRGNKRISNPIIKDNSLCRALTEIADNYLSEEASTTPAVKKSAIALFLTFLYEHLEFSTPGSKDNSSLIRTILSYIHENFKRDISLSGMARELGFTEAYVSRVFHRYIKKSFSAYVNALRVEYIEELRSQHSDIKIINLIYEAGFQSQQTYYRWRNAIK